MAQSNPDRASGRRHRVTSDSLPKLCGADIELGNFVFGAKRNDITCYEAARAVLAEIKGVARPYTYSSTSGRHSQQAPYGGDDTGRDDRRDSHGNTWSVGYNAEYNPDKHASGYGGYGYGSQDWGRKFLPSNGSCVYIDLGHLEVCLPECLSALDSIAAWHAMLRIVRDALHHANSHLADGRQIVVLANNSDGRGNSWGSHMNLLVTRRCFNNLFCRKLHLLLWLASHQISSIVYTGAGKVGSENGRPAADFQLSQRADFYETLTGVQTTYDRPIVNSRDEGLCGHLGEPATPGTSEVSMARLHIIFFDNTLCHVSSFLRVGVTQIIAAMIEQSYIQPGLILDNPLLALQQWTRDVTLRRKARLICGKDYTAVEVQLAMAELAARFISEGRAEGIVPHADRILALWAETLEQLRDKDNNMEALTGKLDWVLKWRILERAANDGIEWTAPQMKYLDHMYGNLDSHEGLYWQMELAGVVQKLVADGQVERFVHEPPSDTRAYTRAKVLQGVPTGSVVNLDWDGIRLEYPRTRGGDWPSCLDFPMHNPLRFTQSEFDQAAGQSATLFETLEQMSVSETVQLGPLLVNPGPGNIVLASARPVGQPIAAPSAARPGANTVGLPNARKQPFEGDRRHGNAPEET
jgi:hypothetical protein